jgi:hypothetical protein
MLNPPSITCRKCVLKAAKGHGTVNRFALAKHELSLINMMNSRFLGIEDRANSQIFLTFFSDEICIRRFLNRAMFWKVVLWTGVIDEIFGCSRKFCP